MMDLNGYQRIFFGGGAGGGNAMPSNQRMNEF